MDKRFAIILLLLPLLASCVTRQDPKVFENDEGHYRSYYALDGLESAFKGTLIEGDIPLWTWSSTPADYELTVLFIHGYLDHSALTAPLIQFLDGKSCRIIAFDLPGHGRSGGKRASLEDFEEYREALERVMVYWDLTYEETLFIGHSTGGALILDRLVEGADMKGAVLAAPLVQFRWYRLSSTLLSIFAKGEVPVSRRRSSHNREFNRMKVHDPLFIKRMPLNWPLAIMDWYEGLPSGAIDYDGPVLILQGEKDHVVYYEKNVPRVMEWYPHADVHYYSQFMHHILNEKETSRLYADLGRWLDQSFFS
ncbi:MAG: alpha/beta fold hydrolase [Spirochaetales bacterium]|nr:alpha/beta fold hydrolase [Spirochaetales bacterium]